MINTVKTLVLETAIGLKQNNRNLATAESCTGGGLSYWLTSVPGSSEWFERGMVTYSNAAKTEMLGVTEQILANFGAVSEETAIAMVEGALKNSHADLAVAITGIAGPDGGTKEKPVGTVWIAWGERNANISAELNVFAGDRQNVRLCSIVKALEKVLSMLAV
jgi:nicotinamide-nucleotide amidase